MHKIDTLVDDIYRTVGKGLPEVPETAVNSFSHHLSQIVKERLTAGTRKRNYLRLSNLGSNCDRALWYSINEPEKAEALHPSTYLKFLLGDVWEAVLLFLAKVSGHKVEGAQDEVTVYGVLGHRDAVIDGMIVDVKSASSRSFVKFTEGLTPEEDAFGYLTQLNAYMEGAKDDPVVLTKDEGAFLVGDKTLGKLTLDRHKKRTDIDFKELVSHKYKMLADKLPPRGHEARPYGKSGNLELGLACSYCEFKKECWPGLRTFLYSSKPVHLVKVAVEPKVPELKNGH
jgi:hypothetical protein